jgi:malate permease and related proteins
MDQALVVGLKIIAMFIVISVGYFCRRKGLLDAQTTPVLSRFVTDITLPPLIFMQMVETVDLASLRVGWVIPVLAVAGVCLGFISGWANWRLFANRSQAPVFIFASGISNWVYLPLPIVKEIYGDTGMQTLFLCNIGIQILFWTLGVAILHGGRLDTRALKHLATNPGLIATVAGIAFAVAKGSMAGTFASLGGMEPIRSSVNVLGGAANLLGQATIPVSLVVTGAQIAAATMVRNHPWSAIGGVTLNRLLVAPLLCIGLLLGFNHLFPVLSSSALMVLATVLLMPVSVTSTVLTEKMDQDSSLAAQTVLYTTLLSIVTVPIMFMLAQKLLA